MNRHIHLSHLGHLETPVTEAGRRYSRLELGAARALLERDNLRFDNATGKIRRTSLGLVEQFSRQSDFTPHTTEEDVMRWEFSRHINNEASRARLERLK